MKKLFSLIVAISAISAFPASAIVGGPWDGNNFNATNSGVYQGVLTFKNGMGMFRFADPGITPRLGVQAPDHFQSDIPNSPRTNQCVIFYKGAVYSGTLFGMADFNYKEVNGVFNGDVTNTGPISNQIDQEGGVPSFGLTAIDPDLNFHDEERSIETCNLFFKAQMTEDAPIVRFSGQGKANFFGQLDTTETERITTTTIIEGDTETEVEILLRGEGGELPLPETIGEQIDVYVYGSQISST